MTKRRVLPATVALFLGLTAYAPAMVDHPPIKEGYWSMHTKMSNGPNKPPIEGTRFVCHSHEYDQYVEATGSESKKKQNCKTISENLSGGTYTSETQCTVAGSLITTKLKTVLTGDSSHTETSTTYDPPFHGQSEATMIQDQKWVGSCPAGIQPGDTVAQDGSVMHLWKH